MASEFIPTSDSISDSRTSGDVRLEVLQLSGLLDTPAEQVFDRYTSLASLCLGVPVSLVSLVDESRQFLKSQVGLPEPWASLRETPLSHSFCQHVVASGLPLIVEDATEDPLVQDNLAVVEMGVMAYAGIPVQVLGQYALGSFCAIDTQPRVWTDRDIEILTSLAEAVAREIDLRFVAKELQTKFNALQSNELMRDDMVQMLIHDLRTPLNSLLGGLQTLDVLITEPDAAQRQMLDISLRGGRSLAQMVNTILDVSRGEAGQLNLEHKVLLPVSLIGIALEQVEQLRQQKALHLTFDLAPQLPPLWGDEEKLRRVLINLLGNAIQHTPREGSIHVRVRTTNEDGGECLMWSVSDTGVGIDIADFDLIFDKFGQTRDSSKRKSSTGLGLTFCKLIVESHGGRIWVESKPGEGSTFYFTIPVRS